MALNLPIADIVGGTSQWGPSYGTLGQKGLAKLEHPTRKFSPED